MGLRINLTMSMWEFSRVWSDLYPQSEANQIALAARQLKNMWQGNSSSWLPRMQHRLTTSILINKLSLVGRELVPTLHNSILILLGALGFHSKLQFIYVIGNGGLLGGYLFIGCFDREATLWVRNPHHPIKSRSNGDRDGEYCLGFY